MGISIREIARKYGVCENTVYRWRRKYAGLSPVNTGALTS